MTEPLSTPAAQGTVAAWKLVPVEPTPDMLDAMSTWAKFPVNAYAAMLSASPSPEALPASGVDVEQATKMVDDFAKLSVLYATDETPHCPTVKDVCDARAKLIAALTSSPAPEDRSDG